ncbi:MAG: response regulator [Burkholderiales bacterium]|nr:response regulator [Burkholderiales bacterium]
MDGTPLRLKLLVIDDDDVDRERVLRLLARTTMTVDAKEASSSAAALGLLREYDFDCIMLDNQLGDASGAELLPLIRDTARQPCPVIMITGAGSESLAVQSLQEGAADYLTKYRLTSDTLARAIRRALEHQRMRRELDAFQQQLEQRVEAQASAIRRSERDLRAILDHTPAVIGYWDAQLRNRFGNRAHRRWFGVDPEALPGRHLRDVIGAAQLDAIGAYVDGALRGESHGFERVFPAPDGVTLRHAQVSLYPDIDEDGRVQGFYSTINDITAIKRAQAHSEELAAFTETLFAHSPVGLGVFDRRLRCIKLNVALEQLLGGAAPDVVGVALADLIADDPLALRTTALATLADGQTRRLAPDLATVFGRRLMADCTWVRFERDGQHQLLLAAEDMTERQHIHDALVDARNAADQATQAKSAFLANMSHEIRTPMSAILGLTHLLARDTGDEVQRERLRMIDGAARHLLQVINDILDLSKIEAGKLRLEFAEIARDALLTRALDMVSDAAGAKGLELIVDADRLPACMRGDFKHLAQALINLLANAVKFTERGWVRLRGEVLAAEGERLQLRFEVRDTGIGIAADRLAAVFSAFEQADSSTTRRHGGTGLGLALTRHIAELMGGQAGVESEPGVGSSFWFTAWVGRGPDNAEVELRAALPGMRALLVDDLPEALQVMADSLRLFGLEVDAQPGPDAALARVDAALAAGQRYDLMLIDWRMETMDGIATLQALRARLADALPPTILLGSHGEADLTKRALAAGFLAVLPKPYTLSALHDALMRVLQRSALVPAAVPAPASGAESELRRHHRGQRVLLAEDNAINQLVAHEILVSVGLDVTIAGDGAAAVELASSEDFDLVLMDMQMPEMDGIDATRAIRAHGGRLPIVAMTANAFESDRQACLDAGMNDHVAKPVDPARLYATLLRWLPRRHDVAPAGSHGPAEPVPLTQRLAGLPQVDLEQALHFVGGSTAALETVMRGFVRSYGAGLPQLLGSPPHGHGAAWRETCHSVRGACAVIGAKALGQAFADIERRLGDGTEPADLGPQLVPLHEALIALARQIESALPGAARDATE